MLVILPGLFSITSRSTSSTIILNARKFCWYFSQTSSCPHYQRLMIGEAWFQSSVCRLHEWRSSQCAFGPRMGTIYSKYDGWLNMMSIVTLYRCWSTVKIGSFWSILVTKSRSFSIAVFIVVGWQPQNIHRKRRLGVILIRGRYTTLAWGSSARPLWRACLVLYSFHSGNVSSVRTSRVNLRLCRLHSFSDRGGTCFSAMLEGIGGFFGPVYSHSVVLYSTVLVRLSMGIVLWWVGFEELVKYF